MRPAIIRIRSYLVRAIGPVALGALWMSAGCAAAPGDGSGTATDSELQALGISVPPSCKVDADCQVVPDYCADCTCVALGANQKQAECLGEELSCVLNPCEGYSAACVEGRCTAASGNLQ
jgi:hypothetical protein